VEFGEADSAQAGFAESALVMAGEARQDEGRFDDSGRADRQSGGGGDLLLGNAVARHLRVNGDDGGGVEHQQIPPSWFQVRRLPLLETGRAARKSARMLTAR
jgi:hypothetical protein